MAVRISNQNNTKNQIYNSIHLHYTFQVQKCKMVFSLHELLTSDVTWPGRFSGAWRRGDACSCDASFASWRCLFMWRFLRIQLVWPTFGKCVMADRPTEKCNRPTIKQSLSPTPYFASPQYTRSLQNSVIKNLKCQNLFQRKQGIRHYTVKSFL